jgi:OOP family OmpA-OmpF porin
VAVVRARACETQLAGLARAGQIRFRLASAELESISFATLDQLAEAAKSCPGMHIEVGGHASSEGSAEINQRLSLERAQSVVAYLVNAGVDAGQLEPIGFGATRPIAPNDNSENMAKNRRIEFTVRPQ